MSPPRNERSLNRSGRGRREQFERILIYCEGANTETVYLKGLRGELRGRPVTVEVGPCHGEPKALVRAAVRSKERFDRDPDLRFDQVWCVFDVEAPAPHPGLAEALREAERAGIRCALSSPCFELWLILHFRAHTGYLTSSGAAGLLATLLPGYDPKRSKAFDYAGVRTLKETAKSRARALHDGHGAETDCPANPCTSMDQLLDALGL